MPEDAREEMKIILGNEIDNELSALKERPQEICFIKFIDITEFGDFTDKVQLVVAYK